MTGEHLWSDWYNHLRPGQKYQLEKVLTNQPPETKTTQAMNLKPKVLCERPCNNEWGHDLEGAARDILMPLLQGEGSVLSPADQDTCFERLPQCDSRRIWHVRI
jgi:hypothetical protein